MNRVLFLILIGLTGAGILISLGIWQVQRLAWKEAVIADINRRIDAPASALPEVPDHVEDAYLPVTVRGQFKSDTLRILVSQKDIGAGYRLITALDMDGRRVLVDRGFIPVDVNDVQTPEAPVAVSGNLQWPQETDGFTPEPDLANNIWFARDVPAMADALATEETLIVARSVEGDDPAVSPFPVDTARIPNDHLQYAITWFSLAAIWLAMSFLFLLRRRGAKTES